MIWSSAFRSCSSFGSRLEIDLLALLAQRRDLPRLEIGLGEDLAVHLDQHLLDDLGAQRRPPPARSRPSTRATETSSVCVVHSLNLWNQYFTLDRAARSTSRRPARTPRPAPADRPSPASGSLPCVNPGFTSPSRARAVHQLGAACERSRALARAAGWGLRTGLFLGLEPSSPRPCRAPACSAAGGTSVRSAALPHQRHQPHRIDLRLRSEL